MRTPTVSITINDDTLGNDLIMEPLPKPKLVAPPESECRICLEGEDSVNNPLICPCQCNGNSKYVHQQCLDTWRFQHPEGSSPRYKCRECQTGYQITYLQLTSLERFTLACFTKFKNRPFLITCWYLIACSLIGGWLDGIEQVRSTFALPYQVQVNSGCLIPVEAVMVLVHTGLETVLRRMYRKYSVVPPRYLTSKLVGKFLLTLPVVYFLPGGMVPVWAVVTFTLYSQLIYPDLVKIRAHGEVVENYHIT